MIKRKPKPHPSLSESGLRNIAGNRIERVSVKDLDDIGWPWVKELSFLLSNGKIVVIRAALEDRVEVKVEEPERGTEPI